MVQARPSNWVPIYVSFGQASNPGLVRLKQCADQMCVALCFHLEEGMNDVPVDIRIVQEWG